MLKTVTQQAVVFKEKPSLWKTVTLQAERVGLLQPGDAVEETETETSVRGLYSKVEFEKGASPKVTGWAATANLGDYIPYLQPIDADTLTEVVMVAARPAGVSPSYLLTVAEIASGLKNEVFEDSDTKLKIYGPFGYGVGDWNRDIKDHPESGAKADQIGDPAAQCILASVIAKNAMGILSANTGLGRAPTVAQLYLANLLGTDCALHVLKHSPDETERVDKAILDFYKNNADREVLVGGILKRRSNYFLVAEKPATLKQALDAIAKRIDEAAVAANKLLDSYYNRHPDEKPPVPDVNVAGTTPMTELPLAPRNTILTVQWIKKLAPAARLEYVDALSSQKGWDTISKVQITANKRRLAGFLANCFHETGGLTILRESLRYKTAARLRAVWPKRFGNKTDAELAPLLNDERALAGAVYAGRMGNRDANDAFIFRGAGFLQTTGRENFIRFGRLGGIDFSKDPPPSTDDADLLLMMAAAEWAQRCNALCDAGKFDAACGVINGQEPAIGLDERRRWFSRISAELELPAVIASPHIAEHGDETGDPNHRNRFDAIA